MKPFSTPPAQKWGLFVLLTGALGFTLSWNPDHLNKPLARNEGGVHTMDLAQEAAKVPPGEEGRPQVLKTDAISGKKGNFKVTVFELNKVTYATFERTSTEASECELCKNPVRPQSSIDRLMEIGAELKGIVDGKEEVKSTASDTKIPQKKGEATDVDLKEWAKKCEEKSDDRKLACHKDRLIELSKYLKNSSETDHFVREYFIDYLQSDLRNAFNRRTLKETGMDSCDGQVLYQNMGRVGCFDASALDSANDMSEEITRGLRAGNGKSVADLLFRMRTSSYSAQLKNSQAIAIEGKNENNMAKFMLGFRGMEPNSLLMQLNQANGNFLDSISQMQGTSSQRSAIESLLTNRFYSPVSSLLNQMKNFVTNGTPGQPNQSHNLIDYLIPSLGMDDRVDSSTYIAGDLGNLPVSVWQTRINNSRGQNLGSFGNSIMSPRGVGVDVFQNNSSLLGRSRTSRQ